MYSAAYVWAKILQYLEERLTEVAVSAWFDDAQVLEFSQQALVLYSPSPFRREQIEKTCLKYIQEGLKELFQSDAQPEIWGDEELKAHSLRGDAAPVYTLNPQFSFDSYIPGPSNEMAYRVTRAAAEDPGGELYNPLFLYGPPGVGKTHLLCALAGRIHERNPGANIVYTRGEQFTNDLIRAIREGGTGEFRKRFRKADVLLVDDIQFIAGKEVTQEEFFHTFNELYEHHRQIVLAADRKPSDMATLEDRLRSRFGEGVMIGISLPELQTRKDIIRAKAKKLGLTLQEEAVSWLAANLTESPRLLEGAIKKLRAYRELTGMELTAENIESTLADLRSGSGSPSVTPALIIRNVCQYYGVEEHSIKGPQKSRSVALPRQVAIYLVRSMLGLSFPEIGRLFSRDSATVQHAVKKIAAALKTDPELEPVLRDIQANITSCT